MGAIGPGSACTVPPACEGSCRLVLPRTIDNTPRKGPYPWSHSSQCLRSPSSRLATIPVHRGATSHFLDTIMPVARAECRDASPCRSFGGIAGGKNHQRDSLDSNRSQGGLQSMDSSLSIRSPPAPTPILHVADRLCLPPAVPAKTRIDSADSTVPIRGSLTNFLKD